MEIFNSFIQHLFMLSQTLTKYWILLMEGSANAQTHTRIAIASQPKHIANLWPTTTKMMIISLIVYVGAGLGLGIWSHSCVQNDVILAFSVYIIAFQLQANYFIETQHLRRRFVFFRDLLKQSNNVKESRHVHFEWSNWHARWHALSLSPSIFTNHI